MDSQFELRQIPLSISRYRQRVENFLQKNNLKLAADIDYYVVICRADDDEILAGGGLSANTIKSIAVSDSYREEGFSSKLISHLMTHAHDEGYTTIRVFTKPENKAIFENLAFTTIATADKAILLESGENNLKQYVAYLNNIYKQKQLNDNSKVGVIVMNANPFTLGHQYLIKVSADKVDHLFIIVVKENLSEYSYHERMQMIIDGCSQLKNVTVCEGSDYQISQTTFPTYFLKQIEDATDTQIKLDLDIFCNHIAPALGVNYRFVGSEPIDKLTGRYNELMLEQLPEHNINFVEIQRLQQDNTIVSASRVRQLIDNNLKEALQLLPKSSYPTVISHIAANCLQAELLLSPKPGLVDTIDNGAHSDMNLALMQTSIDTLQPFFYEFAKLSYNENLPTTDELKEIGLAAEKAMLTVTNGVNTHKGALFSMGLTVCAATHLLYINNNSAISPTALQTTIKDLAKSFQAPDNTHGENIRKQHPNVMGAIDIAQSGYKMLCNEWLPFYRSIKQQTPHAELQLLLKIMTQLDDTNIYHRGNATIANNIKEEAQQVLNNFSVDAVKLMNKQFIERNISPGGSADMLALTLFWDKITTTN